ncbi:hypothetical protein [Chryseobacterium gossypii]|uniref:hypothetical protein n=1 Tax=Chryseobacterium gossypii TaxID=3231602 RepID=UPI00352365DD
MELDAAAITEQIGKGINPDVIGAISSNRKFALVYKGEIIAQGSRYDKVYQKTLMDLQRASSNFGKVGGILEELRVSAFCKRTPKITNKFPTEGLPEDGFILSYTVDSNGIFKQTTGNIFKTREYDFVITNDGLLRLGEKHHLLGNREEVLAAGSMRFKNGKISELHNLSGHYRPTLEEAERLIEILNKLEVPIKRARYDIFIIESNNAGFVTSMRINKRIFIENLK